MDVAHFRNPPTEYREVPFWSWNDELDPAEMRRQAALMDEGGWGGFFMHARVGLKTPYMGRRWMECVHACIAEAKARGMGAWLYDEDKWPSGFAGGLTVSQDPSYRMQYLVCKVDNKPALLPERIATFAAREVEGQLRDVRQDDSPAMSDEGDRLIQFYPQTLYIGIPWFNDYCYVSLLNPEAVRAFIESTHEVYAQVAGNEFGGVIPGVFTDEPAYLWRGGGRGHMPTLYLPWTADFPAYFQQKRGYDLLPHLPRLFFDIDGYQGIRYDFWRSITELFVESYAKQVYHWCDQHKLAFTGHMMAEDTMLSQIDWIGAAMPHYPYFHAPGIDKLGRVINEGQGTILTVKQLDSAVCQLGKKRALCENYGCSGQDFAHSGRKWIGDWAYVLGITLNNPHLAHYSMRGERKRDYPQHLFYQQPWWPENRLIADYFARLSYVLSQGKRVVDILVIHPMGSAWTAYRPAATRAVDELDRALDKLLMTLMNNQRDFHLGDELLMDKGGACEASVGFDEKGPRLNIGQMVYRVVIVPPGVTLSQNTVQVLTDFACGGGQVLALEPRPTLINGWPATGPVLPQQTTVVTTTTLPAALDGILPFDVRVANQPRIWAHHRTIGDAEYYFIANTDLAQGGVATVHLRGEGRLEEWDAATGNVRPVPCTQHDGLTEVVLDFPPAGSHLLALHRRQAPVAVQVAAERVVGQMALPNAWTMTLGGPNSLTLDTAQVQIGDGEWSQPMHILDAHGVVARSGVGAPFGLRFTVAADTAPTGATYLAVESPERFTITVNGKEIGNADQGYWVDSAFRKVSLGRAIKAGRNEIVLRGVFARDSELESVYLLGDFGVAATRLKEESRFNGQVFDRYAPDARLTDLPASIASPRQPQGLAVDLTQNGLPFFAGRVKLSQTLALEAAPAKARLQIAGLRAALAHVRVNGKPAGTMAWQPHQVEVGGLKAGANTIEIELVGTLRNLLGPHHRNGGDKGWTGPNDFRDKQSWTDDYILAPFGFEGATLVLLD